VLAVKLRKPSPLLGILAVSLNHTQTNHANGRGLAANCARAPFYAGFVFRGKQNEAITVGRGGHSQDLSSVTTVER
jgi:hypothetical protein